MRFGNKDGSKAFARDARRALIVKRARARRAPRAINVARCKSGRGRVPGAKTEETEEPVWTIRKEKTISQTKAVEFRQDEVVGSLGQNEVGLLCVLHSQQRSQHQGD